MKPAKDITCLLEIMSALRDPKTGCPWDVAQNFDTIVPYTIEEAYEVADAIKRGDKLDLCDELGDLLLQVVYYAQMAKEEKSFDFEDVVFAITSKMIRRHPHVFGTDEQRKTGMLKGAWEWIKAQEKQERLARRRLVGLEDDEDQSYLAKIRYSQPADREATALQNKAAEVGFDWPNLTPVFEKFNEELSELKDAIDTGMKADVEAEFGDLYFTLLNIARHLKIDPQTALRRTNTKFRTRFRYIEQKMAEKKRTLNDATLEEMEKFWCDAKSY